MLQVWGGGWLFYLMETILKYATYLSNFLRDISQESALVVVEAGGRESKAELGRFAILESTINVEEKFKWSEE